MAAHHQTFGQQAAQRELEQLAAVSEDLILVEDRGCQEEHWLADLVITCRDIPEVEGGLQLERAELFTISVPPDFPFSYPQVEVQHDRFARQPHVQWGRFICLYASDNDWDPRRGMVGLVHQLTKWLEDAVLNRLEGAEAPWHAPVAYPSADTSVIVKADVPPEAEHSDGPWVGWAIIEYHAAYHLEVVHWLDTASAPADLDGWTGWIYRTVGGYRDSEGTYPLFIAPMISLPSSLGFEYPKELGDLLGKLEAHQLHQYDLLLMLSRTVRCNDVLGQAQPDLLQSPPLLLLIGTPGRHEDIRTRVAALGAWRIGQFTAEVLSTLTDPTGQDIASMSSDLSPALSEILQERLRQWPVQWAGIYDQRPQVTVRRDKDRPAMWLSGKRILVLGCGALGAPLAEHCVRAGCEGVELVDAGSIHPGLLVRQLYEYNDIGLYKADALADRLRRIRPDVMIVANFGNALDVIPDAGSIPPEFDLIIDATANNLVAAKIERNRWRSRGFWPPLLTVVVGHEAERGIGMLSPPDATGAGVDILRQVLLQCGKEKRLQDFVDDFLPEKRPTFVAEPGCSAPTYIGSSVDMSAIAALLLNGALAQLSRPASSVLGPVDSRSAQLVRNPATLSWSSAGHQMSWDQDTIVHDKRSGFEIRMATGAWEAIRHAANVADSTQSEGLRSETGGSLFGQIDEAIMVAWITVASGLPEGSAASPAAIRLNTGADRKHNEELFRQSRGTVSFIGLWHSHPNSGAEPSPTDLQTMEDLTASVQLERPRPLLLLILGSGCGQWEDYLMYGKRPELHAQLFFGGSQRRS